jgi:hypothetical protein
MNEEESNYMNSLTEQEFEIYLNGREAGLKHGADEMDLEAISWAINKLNAFGVASNTMENALMVDRLFSMIK